MRRYIDADKLRKDEIARCHCVPCVGSNDNNYKDLDEVLNDAPTADVVEVRHGEWGFDGLGWTCSECGEYALSIKTNLQSRSKYCPNCGADMRGKISGKE
jgi:hypothetical protein